MIGVVSYSSYTDPIGVTRHTYRWESDADGTAEIRHDGREAPLLSGRLLFVTTAPDTSAQPTDNYDVRLYDEHFLNVLQGKADDRDNATAEIAPIYDDLTGGYKFAYTQINGRHRLRVANAGASKAGIIGIYILNAASVP